jgi:uncharacterized protein (DUF486 family)
LLTAIKATSDSGRLARRQASAICSWMRARFAARDTVEASYGFSGGLWMSARVWPVVLLIGSNVFMTFAWYGHLKFKGVALWKVIMVSWGIAFFEYCLQVPANRLGSQMYSPDQLKVIQEVITLTVFGVFSVYYFGDKLHWNHAVAFGCLVAGAFFMFHKF